MLTPLLTEEGMSAVSRFRQADGDGDGRIDFAEFLQVQRGDPGGAKGEGGGAGLSGAQYVKPVSRALFDKCDRSGRGRLGRSDIELLVARLGFEANVDQLSRLVGLFSTDGLTVDFRAFQQLWTFLAPTVRAFPDVRARAGGRALGGAGGGDGSASVASEEAESEAISTGEESSDGDGLREGGRDAEGREEGAERRAVAPHRLRRGVRAATVAAGMRSAARKEPQPKPEPETAAEQHKAPKEQSELRARFDRFDVNGTGELEQDEIAALMAEMGFACDADYLAQLVKKFDTNFNGSVDYAEFKQMWCALHVCPLTFIWSA